MALQGVSTGANLRLTGVEEFLTQLKSVEASAAKRILGRAVSRAATPVQRRARANARRAGGGTFSSKRQLLAKAVGRKTKSSRSKQTAFAVIGARRGFGMQVGRESNWFEKKFLGNRVSRGGGGVNEKRDPFFYGHLVDGDTKPHDIKTPAGTFRHPGTKGNKWLTAAFESEKTNARLIMGREISDGIKREMQR